mmetsp:Transcript_5736/g.19231  ORF Transcript_5736/g.19231 Transcript_5736/m.19231 type:complete len:313 (-) Transcript_5736:362-1300(-)
MIPTAYLCVASAVAAAAALHAAGMLTASATTALWLLVAAYAPSYLDGAQLASSGRDRYWPGIQHLGVWKRLAKLFPATVNVAEPLDSNKQYVFLQIPHGTISTAHLFTMTDGAGWYSKVHNGERRDLAAAALFAVPIIRELVLWFGCVDAGAPTARYHLGMGRSILVFVGGEREQLMTQRGKHRTYLLRRKGIVKLALRYGTPIVPMYCFGENDLYHHSTFLLGLRQWLVKNLRIGFCIFWGPFGPVPLLSLWPFQVPLTVEVGRPIAVTQIDEPTQEKIDEVHAEVVARTKELFNATKARNGYPDAELEVF